MLQELRVENLLLIEQAQLRFVPGLNVITGETGAGKTVFAHSLDLLLGGRARSGIVRPGAREAYVEGAFDLPEHLAAELAGASSACAGAVWEGDTEPLGEHLAASILDAGEIVLARRVAADGRTRAYVNGRAAAVGELRALGAALLVFYGQHEHRKLTLAAAQLEILDGLGGDAQRERLAACARTHVGLRARERELEELRELAGARDRELDLLEFELEEIESLDLQEGERERLLAARERLRRLDALSEAAGAAAESLSPDSADFSGERQPSLIDAAARLEALGGVDERLDELGERVRALMIESQDLAGELRAYREHAASGELEDLPRGPAGEVFTLDALEERLAAIERVARKHGGNVNAVLAYAVQARARREQLAGAEVAIARAGEQLERAHSEQQKHVRSLRAARKAAAKRLAPAVREQLASLAMGDASFEVQLGEREVGPSGADTVEFLIAPNPGVPAAPLRDIASGGELSRVMLAIMGASAATAGGATLVFDEVDAGIGGQAARAVGARLRELGGHAQVLCITHLPQIASLAKRHFAIVKDTSAIPTRASVEQLGEGDVLAELVRMLGADRNDSGARRHARELRKAA